MGLGGGERQTKDGEGCGGGNTTQHTPESRFVPSFLGKGPSALLEEGRVGGETPLQDKMNSNYQIKNARKAPEKANQAFMESISETAAPVTYDIPCKQVES